LVVLSPEINRSRRLVELFLKNVPAQIEAIEQSLKQNVAADVRAHSHKTKGSCLAFGAPAMAKTCEQIQHLSEQGKLSEIEPLVATLKQQFEQVVEELRRSAS
jgi:HPt (histidine-containing phosphotransfer) domain-containing protein